MPITRTAVIHITSLDDGSANGSPVSVSIAVMPSPEPGEHSIVGEVAVKLYQILQGGQAAIQSAAPAPAPQGVLQ
jgi:hypothetical protein